MKLKTKVKAGGVWQNANETMAAAPKRGSKKGLKAKTRVKAGRLSANANQTVVAQEGLLPARPRS